MRRLLALFLLPSLAFAQPHNMPDLQTVTDVGSTTTKTVTIGQCIDSGLTASRAVTSSGTKQLTSSSTTDTELGYVHNVTSAIQTQIDGKFTLPSLTSGSALFSNGTTIAQDNSNFFWNDSSNRLGVGTSSPNATLGVNGVAAIGNVDLGGILNAYSSTSTAPLIVQSNGVVNGGSIIAVNQGNSVSGDVYGIYVNLSSTANGTFQVQQNGSGNAVFGTLVTGAGDPKSIYQVNGVQDWAVGQDQSDSNSFKISASQSLGVSDAVKISTGGEVNITTISGDGTGKVVCIKSDGNLGTCSTAVGAGGTCTCG